MLKGKLIHGITIDDETHTEFVMREATIRDAINAIDKRNASGQGLESYLTLQLYQAAEQLESLGTLSADKIDAELLMNLNEDDFAPLLEALDNVKKKPRQEKKP